VPTPVASRGTTRGAPRPARRSTVPTEEARRLWRFLVEGGDRNADRALALMANWLGQGEAPPPPETVAHAGCYWPGKGVVAREAALARLGRCPPGDATAVY